MNSLLKEAPLFPGLCSATKPAAQSLFSNICMFDRSWASSMLPGERHFVIHWGPHREGRGKERKCNSSQHILFLVNSSGRRFAQERNFK